MIQSYLHKHLSKIKLFSPFQLDTCFKLPFGDIYHSAYFSSLALQASLLIHSYPQLLHQNSHFFGSFSHKNTCPISIQASLAHKDKEIEIIRVQLSEKKTAIYLGFLTFGNLINSKHIEFKAASSRLQTSILKTPLSAQNGTKLGFKIYLDANSHNFETKPENFLNISGAFDLSEDIGVHLCDLAFLADSIPPFKFYHIKNKSKWIPTLKLDSQFYSSNTLGSTKNILFQIKTQASNQNLLEDKITLYQASGDILMVSKRLCYLK